jgi:hypothetical protein
LKVALITAPAPPNPPLVAATPEDAPAPPRVVVTAEQIPSGTVVEIAPAVVWLKLVAFGAGSAKAGAEDKAVATAVKATPQWREATLKRAVKRPEAWAIGSWIGIWTDPVVRFDGAPNAGIWLTTA